MVQGVGITEWPLIQGRLPDASGMSGTECPLSNKLHCLNRAVRRALVRVAHAVDAAAGGIWATVVPGPEHRESLGKHGAVGGGHWSWPVPGSSHALNAVPRRGLLEVCRCCSTVVRCDQVNPLHDPPVSPAPPALSPSPIIVRASHRPLSLHVHRQPARKRCHPLTRRHMPPVVGPSRTAQQRYGAGAFGLSAACAPRPILRVPKVLPSSSSGMTLCCCALLIASNTILRRKTVV